MASASKIFGCVVGVLVAQWLVCSAAVAQGAYQPGQKVEYKLRTWPPGWQVGTVEYMTPSGSQVIVREKPDEFHPQGNTSAYALDEVRPYAGGPPAPDPVDRAKEKFKPGMQVSYPGGVGTVEYVTPSGKQVIVREAPNQFYPQGNTRAYNLDELTIGGKPQTQPTQGNQNTQPVAHAAVPDFPTQAAVPALPVVPAAQPTPAQDAAKQPVAQGPAGPVMTAQDVVNLFAAKIGDPNQLSWPKNEQIYNEVASIIRARGVDFRYDSAPQIITDAVAKYRVFSNVTGAIRQNLGPPPGKAILPVRGICPRLAERPACANSNPVTTL